MCSFSYRMAVNGAGPGQLEQTEEGSAVLGRVSPREGGGRSGWCRGADDAPGVLANDIFHPPSQTLRL